LRKEYLQICRLQEAAAYDFGMDTVESGYDEADLTEHGRERLMPGSKALLGSLLILASLLTVGACDQTKRYTEQELVQRAKDFQAQGKPESAVIELKNALQQNPKNGEARLRLGEIYAQLGFGEQAEIELKRAEELGIDDEALKVPMGRALLLRGLYQRVVAEIQPDPKSPPGDISRILEIQGRAQLGLLHLEEGCKLFAQSVDKDPQYVPAYWGLARCAAMRGKLDKARAELDKAVKLDEKNSQTWALLGDLERVQRRLAEADSAYANSLKYKSNNMDALLGRAVISIENNKLDEASRYVDTAFKLSRDHPLVSQLRGVVQYRQGKYAAAETSFQNVLKSQPNYLPAILWLGLANFAQGNYELAGKQFGQYARSVPSVRVQALLALVQAKLGRGQEAAEALSVLRNVDVKDPQSLAVVANAYMSIGETDLAAKYLTKAVEQKPDAANLRVALAATLSQKGDRAHAIEQLESAIQLDSGMANADVLLIQSLIQDKQFDKALVAVQALEKKQPKNAVTHNLKGAIYLAKNDIANGRKSFERALELDPTSVPAAMNLAQLDLLERKPEAARQRFQGILAKDKANVQAMIGLAGIAAATSQETEYVAWLEKAAKAGPSVARPRVLLASYYLQKNEVQKALALAREAQTANPGNFQALDLLGTVQLAAGEKENATITYAKLAKLFTKSPVAHYKLATAQAATNNVAAVRASLKSALTLKPDYLDAEMLLGSVELGAGRHVEALKIARQIQKQHPKSASGLVLQGDILMAQKQFAPAVTIYEKALAINNNGLIAVQVYKALSAAGKVEEADARLVQWLKDRPGELNARIYLASTYVKARQNKQAIQQYQLVLQADPKNVRALNDLAWLYQQEQDPRALATAEQAYRLKPDNPEIMDTLGWILVDQDQTTRGTELLRKAAEAAPASTAIRYHWAAALVKSGDKARARTELTDLLTRNKDFPQRQEAQALLKQL
jgi:putative PEP-CTERM system TPR-repeat lipoprotein